MRTAFFIFEVDVRLIRKPCFLGKFNQTAHSIAPSPTAEIILIERRGNQDNTVFLTKTISSFVWRIKNSIQANMEESVGFPAQFMLEAFI